ncbi:MAG: flagellar biosynthesis protein FlgL [Xanthobacteraceae bacterium]|nr:MAG: flagellar biosynthesis protein FlgL [Xanthobacteraceae bacterium]
MALNGIGTRSTFLSQSLVDTRQQLEMLQTQLSTGRKADTYSGMGVSRGFGISLRTQMTALDGYADTITNVDTRLNITNAALSRMVSIGKEVRTGATTSSLSFDQSGQTTSQKGALSSLGEMLQLLNTQSGDRYLFSGRATDTPAVAGLGDILDGSGAKAGLKQLIAERKLADVGASGLGRLTVSAPTATSVALAEDAAGSPFGLKLNAITSSLSGATVTGPAGSPPAISVDLGATNPSDGDKVKFTFDLPDGTTETIELAASNASPLPANSFAIGATPAATAANLQSALTSAVAKLADTSLVAASALAASDNFFNSQPPLRVAGPPFDSATSLVAGTAADTVMWYTGEAGGDPARGTAVARIDQSMAVQYGVRADEQAFRWQLQNIATFAVLTTNPASPNAAGQITALNERIAHNMSTQVGQQHLEDIQADLAGAQNAMKAAKDRQTQTKSMLQTMLDSIEGVSNDEVGTQILALQTSLQASYQTTAMLYQTSLVKFL